MMGAVLQNEGLVMSHELTDAELSDHDLVYLRDTVDELADILLDGDGTVAQRIELAVRELLGRLESKTHKNRER